MSTNAPISVDTGSMIGFIASISSAPFFFAFYIFYIVFVH